MRGSLVPFVLFAASLVPALAAPTPAHALAHAAARGTNAGESRVRSACSPAPWLTTRSLRATEDGVALAAVRRGNSGNNGKDGADGNNDHANPGTSLRILVFILWLTTE